MRRLIGVILFTALGWGAIRFPSRGRSCRLASRLSIRVSLLSGDFCGFPVEATILQNNQTVTIHQDGRQRITGALKVQLTNTLNDKSITSNISGPTTFTPNGDGSFTAVFRGRSLIFPNDMNVMFVSSGRVIMRVNREMTFFSLLSVTGTSFDARAALR